MKKQIVLLLSFMLAMLLVGCFEEEKSQTRVQEANQAVGIYEVETYLERQNIEKRLRLFDNPSQVSWIYCLAENGQVVFYGPVLGKVTSSGKRLEPKEVDTDSCASFWDGDCINELMGADATYGSSDPYVFWFDPQDNYYQWGGNYFLTSVPIKIESSVLNVREVD